MARTYLAAWMVLASASACSGADTATTEDGLGAGPVTTVRVHYDGLPGSLSLRGSAGTLAWDRGAPLRREGDAWVWSSRAVSSPIELKPMLDEAWSRGPNHRVSPGETIDLYPRFVARAGRVEARWPSFTSQKLPSTRALWVYLPPTYLENRAARFGVVYLQDGQNLFAPELAFGGVEWQVDETLDAGAEDGTIRETIAVGIQSTGARIDELTPTRDRSVGAGGRADDYLAMLTDEVKPLVDRELRTLPARETTTLVGSSLGGLFSAYGGVKRGDVFGRVGQLSPSTWWDDRFIVGLIPTLGSSPERPDRVYVDSGDAGPSADGLADTRLLAERYRAAGYVDGRDLLYVVQPGAAHNERYWAERLPTALRFLVGPRPN